MSNQDLYIHIQVSMSGNFLKYKAGTYALGTSLLNFVYFNMEPIFVDAAIKDMVIEELRKAHPYFAGLSSIILEEMILSSDDDGDRSLNIYKIKELQEKYLKLIGLLEHHNNSDQTANCQYLLKYKLFSQSKLLTDQSGEFYTDYYLMAFEDCLYVEIVEMLKHQKLIKKCKNCNRYFIPQKANIDYCNRIYHPEPKTCQEVGYTKTFAKAIKGDDLLSAYTRAYKAHYARMSKPRKNGANLSREDFTAWYLEAKEKLKQARDGEMGAEEFKTWLKQ